MQHHQSLLGHSDVVGGLAFSPDGKHLFTSSADDTTRTWDISSSGSAEIGAIPGSELVTDLIHDGEKSWIVTSSSDGMVKILDPEGLQEQQSFVAHQDVIRRIDESPDGKMVATAGLDGIVKVWEIETGELLLEINAHETQPSGFFRGVLDVDFSPDSKLLVTGGVDGETNVWDINTGELLKNLVNQDEWVLRTAFHPSESWVATSYDSSIKIWDAVSGELLQELVHENWEIGNQGMWGLDFSPDGSQLITGRSDGAVEIWQLPTRGWQPEEDGARLVHDVRTEADFILSTRFHPDGEQYAISTLNGLIELRDSATKELLLSIQQSGAVALINFSPDGKRMYAIGLDGSVQVYALDLQELITLAHSRVTRSLTTDECRTYLHVEACP
jgi:WD40 repeat protein